MRKKIIFLLLLMTSSFYSIGQDLIYDHILVSEEIQLKAKAAIINNKLLSEDDLQRMQLYAARETNSGYNFIYHHYINEYLVEGDGVKIILDDDFNVKWSEVDFSRIKLDDFSSIGEFEAIHLVKNHAYLKSPEILRVAKVVAKVEDENNWNTYFRLDVKDLEARVHLKYYVNMKDGSIAGIFDLYSEEIYTGEKIKKEIVGSRVMSVCCDNANANGRYHIVDPNTTSTCSDINVPFHSSGGDFVLGLSNDNVTFDDNSPPIADSDGIFCYDFDTQEYNKLHSYIYTKELLEAGIGDSPTSIELDVNGSSNAFVSTSNDEITFGSNLAFDDMAADRFHIAHGFFQIVAKNRVSGLVISNSSGTGSIDYLVMSHYGEDGYCYDFGGIQSIGIRRTNHIHFNDAISENGLINTDEAQAWSSYLMRIGLGLGSTIGVGTDDTDKLLFDVIEMLGSDVLSNIQLLFQTAKTADYIDNEELCRIYKITMDYTYGVVGLKINLDDMPDLYIKDSTQDIGEEPYSLGQRWTSPSIWNTVGSPDGPMGNPETGSTNYIHILVEDVNGIPVNDKYLHVYFSMASLGLIWPEDWMDEIVSGQLVSGEMTPQQISGPGEYVFEWNPPIPSELNINNNHQVCIYARITDENNTVRNRHCDVEESNIAINTNRFNSIAWKNLSIIESSGIVGGIGDIDKVNVFVKNTNPADWYEGPNVPKEIDLFSIELVINPMPVDPNILDLGPPDINFFKHCELHVEMDSKLVSTNGLSGQGFVEIKKGLIKVTDRNFKLEGLKLKPEVNYQMLTIYKPLKNKPVSFSWVLKNYKGEIVGGELYQSTFPKKYRRGQDNSDLTREDFLFAQDESKVKIVPNPTFDSANIYSKKRMASIDILDNNGFRIKRKSFAKSEVNGYRVNLEGQLTGVYTIRIVYADGTVESVKLIKK